MTPVTIIKNVSKVVRLEKKLFSECDTSIKLFNKHLESQEAQFGDGGFKDTENERLLCGENPHLEFEKVITIIYEADLVALLPSEEIANTLHHVFYGYLYNKVHLTWYNWRFWLK